MVTWITATILCTLDPTLFPDPPAKGVLKGSQVIPSQTDLLHLGVAPFPTPTTQWLILAAAGAPFVTICLAHFWLHFNIREISYE